MEKKNSKITESISNILIEHANICNIFPRPVVSNRLIIKLKGDLKYRFMFISNQFVHTVYTKPFLI